MKWMLVVLLLGSTPVKTDLIYNSLDECLDAEEDMRTEVARAYSKWEDWAKKNAATARYPESQKWQQKRIGISHGGTCIPHK